MTALTAIRERLARAHMNHGCDTWPEHMRDCEALLEVAEAAEDVDAMWPSKNWATHYTAPIIRLKEALARLTQEEGA